MSTLGPSPLIANDRHLSVAQAREAILAPLRPVAGTETLSLAQALGRVLAQDLICPMNVPPHDNSAMDGYAFDGSALAADPGADLTFSVAGTAYAGQAFTGAVGAGQAVRIMTGAVMPAGLDTVVPQELVKTEGEEAALRVTVPAGTVKRGENRRRAGEDLALGKPALRAGRVLRPSDLGLAASLGFAELTVRRRLRVALISTGDELRNPGQPLPEGCIYDSNRASLAGALRRLGVEVVDQGLVPDDPAALEAAFTHAAAACDAVLTSGGVSVGEADYTRDLLARLGEVAFWKVAMRPGRPFAFGPLRRGGGGLGAVATVQPVGQVHTGADPVHAGEAQPAWLFALPGNPVAALVTFYAFVREALQVLAGAPAEPPMALRVKSAEAIRKRPGRTEFQRAIVQRETEGPLAGEWTARITGSQGAGILRSLSEANALLVLGHDQGSVAAGEPVEVWMFEGLV
ncbi:MAG: gephyrin-like molybdotransferase Glp [Betaproteobacteria bacterium]